MKKTTNTQYPSVSQVSDAQLVNIVKEIFCTINPKYDFLNHFLSLRRDVAWRRFAVRKMRFFQTYRFLDVATGTCDLAIEAALRYPHIQVVGLDFVEEMMCVGLQKIQRKNLSPRIEILKGDVLHIPSPPHCFDVAGIAFGIRNIPDKINALKEMMRVVVPGGQVLVLEITSPQNPFFRVIYTMYLKRILPRLALAFSPNPMAYHYLWDSIMNFPAAHDFALLMKHAGLVEVETHALTLGITHLHIGYKPHMN
jgi:demethylmenaquinone methyltransferase/2-methoxy-6-polyprenyl-1,4-benzoquinol methylase